MWEHLGSENWIQVLEPDRELRASALARVLTMWSLQGQVADKCVCGLVVLVWAASPPGIWKFGQYPGLVALMQTA